MSSTGNSNNKKFVDRLHDIEHAAADAYHALEDHNAKELQQDVRGVIARLSAWLGPHVRDFKAWYLSQSTPLKIVYGLTVVPVVALLALLIFLLVKFGAPILLALALALKFALTIGKIVFFIGYIIYKILKTILMWYYSISRLYLGNKAKRKRFAQAQTCEFPLEPATALGQFSIRCRHKDLYIIQANQGQVRILFSYLRYAIRGQKVLLNHFLQGWRHYLTLWRQQSRDAIKAELAPVGASMFKPHTLGADVGGEEVLVPGDAELIKITLQADSQLGLAFRVRWVEWQFKFRKALKFLQIKRNHQETVWNVKAALQSIGNSAL